MRHFHEMRLFMFARKHIKIFCNHWISELETAVFGEMFVKIYFLNFLFMYFCFTFAWVSKLVSSEKALKSYLVTLYGFLFFFKTKTMSSNIIEKQTSWQIVLISWIFHPFLRKSQNRLFHNYHERLLSIGYHSSYSISRNL